MLLEVAVFNKQDALKAAKAGADRLEICSNYTVGGITCSKQDLQEIRNQISIPIFAIIRPRGGDFNYTQAEFLQMKNDIEFCKQLGYDGIVTGILNANNIIDENRTIELVQLANPLPVTFHRAFDKTPNLLQALEQIIHCGCQRILTSGAKPTAYEGKQVIKELIKVANNKINILPGGGIRSLNLNQILQHTKAKEFHSAALNHASSLDEKEIEKMKKLLGK